MPTDTADIRQYLTSAYSDEELTTLCADYFRDVYENFTGGMPKTVKIRLLLDYCQRRDLTPNLLAALERERPEQYRVRFGQVAAAPAPVPAQAPARRDPRQVFLSHAHEDADFAHRLAADLRAHGWWVWIAPDSILPGEKWLDAIERGLATSGVFIVALTPAAIRSRWVKSETNAAITLEHREAVQLVPLGVEPCDIPLMWSGYQFISFGGRYESGLTALLAALGDAGVRPTPAVEAQRSPDPVIPAPAKEQPAKREDTGVAAPAPASQPAVPKVAREATRPVPPSPDLLTIESPIRMEFVRVPAGEFLMGSDPRVDKDAGPNEQPQHRLYLPEFYIGQYPVTNEQYATFVKATRQAVPRHWKNGKIPTGKEDYPVVNVSWRDAVAFCQWLGKASGKVVRLPTEAEWEKAARGADGRIYPWGNDLPTKILCNFNNRFFGGTTPVGQYPTGASPCGALDMAGNVAELTGTLWGVWFSKYEFRYPYDAKDGRENLNAPDTVKRVVRGGSFPDGAHGVRCAVRYLCGPSDRGGNLGFRVVSPGL